MDPHPRRLPTSRVSNLLPLQPRVHPKRQPRSRQDPVPRTVMLLRPTSPVVIRQLDLLTSVQPVRRATLDWSTCDDTSDDTRISDPLYASAVKDSLVVTYSPVTSVNATFTSRASSHPPKPPKLLQRRLEDSRPPRMARPLVKRPAVQQQQLLRQAKQTKTRPAAVQKVVTHRLLSLGLPL